MVWEQIPLWQRLLLYGFILIALFIYVKTSQLKVLGKPLIPLRWRILLALFFPLIFIVGLAFGALLIAAVLTIVFFLFLWLFYKVKIQRKRKLL